MIAEDRLKEIVRFHVAHCLDDAEELAMARELLALREANRWVPVSERLPVGEDHLLHCDAKDDALVPWQVVGYWNRLTKCWMVAHCQERELPVTHFRPLPAAPEVQA